MRIPSFNDLFFKEMIEEFKLDTTSCDPSTMLVLVGLDIMSTNNDHCLLNVSLTTQRSNSRLSNWFKCQKPFVAIANIKLENQNEERICIAAVGLETRKKKFLKEGLKIHLQPKEWSPGIKTQAYGEVITFTYETCCLDIHFTVKNGTDFHSF